MTKTLLSAFAATALLSSASQSALIITEWMANPAATTDAVGEYIEVYNSGPGPINVGDLTLTDDGSDSKNLAGATEVIASGSFFVFAVSALPHADFDYGSVGGSYFLSNGADEIVIVETGSGTELARVNYTNGDPAGAGTSVVLNDISNAVGGVTQFSDYAAEVAANDTIADADLGSPGIAGSTVIPEPGAFALVGIAGLLGLIRRRR